MVVIEKQYQVVFRNDKPQAIILDIKKYERLLESLEEKEDLSELRKIKRAKTSFHELKKYLGKIEV